MTGGSRRIPGTEIRRVWGINPITRVHEHDPRKLQKKERQAIKKRLAKESRDERQPLICLWVLIWHIPN